MSSVPIHPKGTHHRIRKEQNCKLSNNLVFKKEKLSIKLSEIQNPSVFQLLSIFSTVTKFKCLSCSNLYLGDTASIKNLIQIY